MPTHSAYVTITNRPAHGTALGVLVAGILILGPFADRLHAHVKGWRDGEAQHPPVESAEGHREGADPSVFARVEAESDGEIEEPFRGTDERSDTDYEIEPSWIIGADMRAFHLMPPQLNDMPFIRAVILPKRVEDSELLRQVRLDDLRVVARAYRRKGKSKVQVRVFTSALHVLPKVAAPHGRVLGRGQYRQWLLLFQTDVPIEHDLLSWGCSSGWRWAAIGDADDSNSTAQDIRFRVVELTCYKRASALSWLLRVIELRVRRARASSNRLVAAVLLWLQLPWTFVLIMTLGGTFVISLVSRVVRIAARIGQSITARRERFERREHI